MKKTLLSLMLVWSWATLAAPSASLEYTCEIGEEEKSGKVYLDEDSLQSLPSCISFKKFPPVCFRFERRISINSIFLFLGYANKSSKDITQSNLPFGEGSLLTTKLKSHMGIQKDLTCTFTNVNWDTSFF
jgi:hypothetical protein